MFFSKLDKKIIKKHEPLWLLGCDEVGRGCLAGPVVAACVAVNIESFDEGIFSKILVNDSKKMTALKRRSVIHDLGIKWDFHKKVQNVYNKNGIKINISQLSAQVVDDINIFQASLSAMSNALNNNNRSYRKPYLLVDGKWNLGEKISNRITQQAVIKGDSLSSVIALASIVAKEFRDSLMSELYDKKYPLFQFRKNMGYPTKSHKLAIEQHGILPIHRKTFRGVSQFVIKKASKQK